MGAGEGVSEGLTIYVVYKNPSDYPGKYVVRPQRVSRDAGIVNEPVTYVGESLQMARASIPPCLSYFPRHPGDDPVILEAWL